MADADHCDLLCLDLEEAERLRAVVPAPDDIAAAAARAKALGDPTRLALAVALDEAEDALCVCDLAWISGRSENLVSHHVRVLRGAGLATSRREGKMVLYRGTAECRALLRVLTGAPA